jgi:hypothetical protein
MSIRFRKSIKLAPGIRWNISSGGASWTFGPRGASVNVGKRGTFLNSGIPGTGLSSRSQLGASRSRSTSSSGSTTTIPLTVGISDDGTLYFQDREGNPVTDNVVETAKKQNRAAIQGLIERKCEEINAQVEGLGKIHWDTPDCNIRPSFEAPDFEVNAPVAPVFKKPGFFERLFKSRLKRIEASNEALRLSYELQLETWVQERTAFDRAVAHNRDFVQRLIYTDTTAMEQYLEGRMQEISWPRETSVSFEVRDGGQKLYCDVDLPELEEMPKHTAAVPSRGLKLTLKEFSQTKLQKLYSEHIHGVVFRITGEIFAALPTLEQLTISAYSQRRSKVTGALADEYLISAKIDRSRWQQIDFSALDSIDVTVALERFELRRTLSKSAVFTAIERF